MHPIRYARVEPKNMPEHMDIAKSHVFSDGDYLGAEGVRFLDVAPTCSQIHCSCSNVLQKHLSGYALTHGPKFVTPIPESFFGVWRTQTGFSSTPSIIQSNPRITGKKISSLALGSCKLLSVQQLKGTLHELWKTDSSLLYISSTPCKQKN